MFEVKLKKFGLMIAGIILVILGILGIFLPLLPTTPFLLLAAACFARSSPKLYQWLLNHRYLGNYIKNYRQNKGIPIGTKIVSITVLWLVIGYSSLFAVESLYFKALLIVVSVGVTIHLIKMRTLRG